MCVCTNRTGCVRGRTELLRTLPLSSPRGLVEVVYLAAVGVDHLLPVDGLALLQRGQGRIRHVVGLSDGLLGFAAEAPCPGRVVLLAAIRTIPILLIDSEQLAHISYGANWR